jgi:hypothetical protein
MIKGSFPRNLWKYVNPASNAVYHKPEEITYGSIRAGATMLRELSMAKKTTYSNLKISSKFETSQYQRYLAKETKIRKRIMCTTTAITRALLQEDESIREWISNIQSASKSTDA